LPLRASHIRERNHAVSIDGRLGQLEVYVYIAFMADVVNLKRARKAKARAEADGKAQENRVAFGRTKNEKKLAQTEKDAARRKHEGHKRDDA
jgi:hypothetical protein